MSGELRILLLEDSPADAELAERALRRAGLAFRLERVDQRADFIRAMTDFAPDLVLADFTLPGFDALTALALARKLGPPVPFIVLTGRTDEETAAACLQAGADDFVLKDQLPRLPAVVQGVLGAHRARLERRRADEAYRSLAENGLQALVILQDRRAAFVNAGFCDLVGWSAAEILAMDFPRFQELVHPDDRALVWDRFRERSEGKSPPPRYEFRALRRDGTILWVELHSTNILYQGRPAVQVALIDVTERRRAQEQLQASRAMLRQVVDSIPRPLYWKDPDGTYLGANLRFAQWVGMASPEDVSGRVDSQLCWSAAQAAWLRACEASALAEDAGEGAHVGQLTRADGVTLRVTLRTHRFRGDEGVLRGVIVSIDDAPAD